MDNAETTAAAAAAESDDGQVLLPRWAVRITLALCPFYALLIAGHAFAILFLDPFIGFGGVLTRLFWLGTAGFCVWSSVLGLLYLRREDDLSDATRGRLALVFAVMMGLTGLLAMANLLAG